MIAPKEIYVLEWYKKVDKENGRIGFPAGCSLHLPRVLNLCEDEILVNEDSFRHGTLKKMYLSNQSLYFKLYRESVENDRGLRLSQKGMESLLAKGDILISNENFNLSKDNPGFVLGCNEYEGNTNTNKKTFFIPNENLFYQGLCKN